MIGQSLPFSDPRPSSIIAGNEKWIGPTWANVSDDLILSLTPSKTADRTGKRVLFDLRLCPLVLENLPAIRSGPLVIDDAAGLPWRNQNFRYLWNKVRP